MSRLKKIIVFLAVFASINLSEAQQWSPITNNNIWNLNTGNVGIGTTNPRGMLEVFGNNVTPKVALRFTGSNQSASNYIQSDTDGHYLEFSAFGTSFSDPLFGLSLAGSTAVIMAPKTTGKGFFGTTTVTPLVFGTSNAERMRIDAGGNVGIGTMNPDTKLTVNGTIHATEVIVDLNIPADYVFKSSYKLMPLHEVEQYVKTNSHLPGIPSATEITKNGLSMGEMQNKLLQKVEELTLYVIQQDKSKKELERKYNALMEKLEIQAKGIEKK